MRTQEQKMNIKIGVNESLKNRKNNKIYIGSYVPYGYKRVDGKLIKDENVYFIVYLIFKLYDKGYSFTHIADYLNERNIVNPSSYRLLKEYMYPINNDIYKKWTRGSIRKIIENRVYSGFYNYSNEYTHEAIIDSDLFKKVSEFRNNKKNSKGYDHYHYNNNEFIGKIICGECGENFTVTNCSSKNGVIRYLRCASYDKRLNKKNCPNSLGIKYDDLKNILNMYINKEIISRVDIKSMEKCYEEYNTHNDINYNIECIKRELKVLNELLTNNTSITENQYDTELYLEKNKIYNIRIEELNRLLKELKSLSRTKKIKKEDFILDRFIINQFVDKITIYKLNNDNRNIDIVLKI